MKKVLVMLALVSALIDGTAWCQSMVWEMPNMVSDTSIIRYWKDDTYIVYSRAGSNPGEIVLHDNNNGTILSTTLPPNIIINDFRIANDTVFAGGSVLSVGSSTGLIACFAINDLLNGTGVYYACFLNGNNLGLSNCSVDFKDLITGVTRLTLYNDGGHTRIAYVANNIIVDRNTNEIYYRRIGYGDAAFLSTWWDIQEYHYNKDGYDDYSDITTTDNYIVIPARTNDSALFKFQVFDKVVNYAAVPPSTYTWRYGTSEHNAVGKVMTTGIVNDFVAMSYHYKTATSCGLAVKVFYIVGGVPSLLHSIEIPFSNDLISNWVMRDMRYNQDCDKLWILNDIDNPVTGMYGSYIVEIDMGSITTGTYNFRYLPTMKTAFSMDNFTANMLIESGTESSGILNTFIESDSPSVSCGVGTVINGSLTTPRVYKIERHHCTYFPNRNSTIMPFTIVNPSINSICNY